MSTQKKLLAAALFATAAYAFTRLLWLPLSSRAQTAETKLDDAGAKVEKMKRQAARLDRLQKELVALNEAAVGVERVLPKTRPSIQDLGRVKELAGENSVTLSELAAENPVHQAYFIELSYDAAAQATSQEMARFLKDLAGEERLALVKKLAFGPPEAGGKRRVTFKLVFYQQKS